MAVCRTQIARLTLLNAKTVQGVKCSAATRFISSLPRHHYEKGAAADFNQIYPEWFQFEDVCRKFISASKGFFRLAVQRKFVYRNSDECVSK
jgi:hypothetical protein